MKVFLLVLLSTGGQFFQSELYPMPSWEMCYKTLEKSQIRNCAGGDCENAIGLTCVSGRQE